MNLLWYVWPSRHVNENNSSLLFWLLISMFLQDMAYVLAIESTAHTAQDKREFIKRIRHEEKLSMILLFIWVLFINNK